MLILCTAIVLANVSAQAPQAPSQQAKETAITNLRTELRALERSFGGIKVTSECTWTKREAGDDEFQDHGSVTGTYWFSSKPGGFARCEVDREVSRWMRGPSEFAESSFLMAYDGRIGQVLRTSTGSMDEPIPIKRAIFVPHRPSHSELGARASGWRFSTLGFFDQVGGRFSEMLQFDRYNLEIATTGEGEARRIQLDRTMMLDALELHETWVLDPNRSYALLDYKYRESGTVKEHIVVEQLTESLGLYWPAKVVRDSLIPDGGEAHEVMRMQPETLTHEAAAQVAWHLDLPAGTTLEDPISDVVLTLGYSEEELNPLLDADSDLLADSLVDAQPLDTALLTLPEPESDSDLAMLLTRIALFAAGLGIVGFAVMRMRVAARQPAGGQVAGVATLLVLALLSAPTNAQQVSLVADELGNNRVHNCGVNASAVILRAFGKDAELQAIGTGLACGDHWERVVSLGQIQTLFETRGLTVQPMQQHKPEQILASLGRRNVALVHIESAYQPEGHFIVLGGTRGDKILEIDPARSSRWVTVADFLSSRRHVLTGYGLLVSDGASRGQDVVPTLPDDATQFDLDIGDVSEVKGIVTTSVRVPNRAEQAMTLSTSASSCTCFQGAVFDSGKKSIPAGGEDVLHLQFDRAKLGVGENEQNVLITFAAGGVKRNVLFRVRVLVRSTKVSRKASIIPSQVDWGVVRDRVRLGEPKRVSLQLPQGVLVESAKPSSDNVQVRRVRSTNDKGSKYRAPSRTETFEVTILSAPSEYVKEEILFVLSDPQLKTLRLAVLADVLQ